MPLVFSSGALGVEASTLSAGWFFAEHAREVSDLHAVGFLALELETGTNQFLVDARVEFSYQSEVLRRMDLILSL